MFLQPFTIDLWLMVFWLGIFSGVVMWSTEAAISNDGKQ
jgi:hypothetical protein